MTTVFEPPTWQVPPDQPAERVHQPAPPARWSNAPKLIIVAVAAVLAAALTYRAGYDHGKRDAVQHCQDATPGIVTGIGRLVGPSGSRLVVCTVPRN